MKFSVLFTILACVSFGFIVVQADAAIDPETVVGAWMFDEGSGDVASDISDNGLDGTLQGGPKWVNGKFGKALQLDGIGAFVEVPAHENPREAITVSIWVKSLTDNWNQHGWMVEKRDSFILHPVVNTKNVGWALCNGACWNKPGAWSDGAVGPDDITEWHMYTNTFDSSTGEWFIYVDAKEESAMNLDKVPLNADTGPMFIGQDTCCAGRFGNAIVDEVAIFDVALEQADIQTLMDKGLSDTVAAVEAENKMTTTWANVKIRY